MKKLLSAAVLFFAVIALCSTALAAEITITTDPATITSAGSVDIKINIVNDSSEYMTEISCVGHGINNPSQLYNQALPAGKPLPITVKGVGINADMLGVPQTYAFSWLEGSERKSKNVTVTFGAQTTPSTAAMTATRTLSRDSGKEGDKITLTYTLKNPSTTSMTEVTVLDTIAGTKEVRAPFTLDPGVSQTVTYEYTLGKESATSSPTITYKVNGETKTLEIPPATIKISSVNLQASVSQSEPSPEGIVFTIVLSNQGNQDITKITVTDELGEKVNATSLTLKAGEETTLTHTVNTDTLRNVSFTISGTDASGQPYENKTRSLEARPYVNPDNIKFTMFVTVVEPLTESGRMKVRFAIQNDSTVEMTNATISEAELGVLETRDILESGETIIEKELRISAPRELQFTLSAYDPSGSERAYQAQVPAAYMPSANPVETPPMIVEEPNEEPAPAGLGGDTLITVLIVLASLMGIAGVALLVLSIYERKKGREMPDYEGDDLPVEPVRAKKEKKDEGRLNEAKLRPEQENKRRASVREDKYEAPQSEIMRREVREEPRSSVVKRQPDVPQGVAYKKPAQYQEPAKQQYTEPARPQYTEPARYSEPAAPQYPETPRYNEPQKPQYSEPPRYTEPVKPQYVEPPRYTEPAKPQYVEPPRYTEPVKPQYNEPPRYTEPVKPQYSEPPRYTEPVKPQYNDPQRYTEPAKPQAQTPMFSEPARPQYNEPVKPQYDEPAAYTEPVKPQYAQPARYTEPAKPQYTEPARHTHTPPAGQEDGSYTRDNKPVSASQSQRSAAELDQDDSRYEYESYYQEPRTPKKAKPSRPGGSARYRVHRVKPVDGD